LEKLKSLGLNPKKSITNKTTTDSPVNHFNEFFFGYSDIFKCPSGIRNKMSA
jgi:hypothetical protein